MIRRIFLVSSALAIGGVLAACSDSGNKQGAAGAAGAAAAQQAAPVGVISLTKATFPVTTILPGRAEASQIADIRPQVSGIIREIPFKEGGEVKKGDVLYQIEDAPYLAPLHKRAPPLPRPKPAFPARKAISIVTSA